jgi:hypothetical protein
MEKTDPLTKGKIMPNPLDVLSWLNVGTNLVWDVIQIGSWVWAHIPHP